MFRTANLDTRQAHTAYPLVACNYPALSLQSWTEFVRRAESGKCDNRLMGLIDARGLHHSIFGWRVAEKFKEHFLKVTHIATFQLAGDAVHRALYAALEQLARENGCRKVIIDPWVSEELGITADQAPKAPTFSRILCIAPATDTRQTLN
jgi:hypothetical protein